MAAMAAILDFWSEWFYFNIIIIFFFWSSSHPDATYQVSSQLAFRVSRKKRKKEKIF